MLLPKGSRLICPNCGTEIYKLKVNIEDEREGTNLLIDEIKPLNEFEPEIGAYPKCPNCSEKVDMYEYDNYKKSDN